MERQERDSARLDPKGKRPFRVPIYPALVFIASCLILAGVLYHSYTVYREQMERITKLNTISYANRLANDLGRGIAITDAVESVVLSDAGKINAFSEVAENLMTDYVQSIQLAPDGIVTEIYPETGNEAGKIDLFQDEKRGAICRYGRDHGVITMQGPFKLKQGGQGIAIRNPVYLREADGSETFWGFAIVIIRVPEIFEDTVKALSDFGYDYQLTMTSSPLSDEQEQVSSSVAKLTNPVNYQFQMEGTTFCLSVMPKQGWNRRWIMVPYLILGICIILSLTGLSIAMLQLRRHRDALALLSVTDPLTGLLNRHGFDEAVRRRMKKADSSLPCVGMQMDIDDFKFINDLYGHDVGDQALKTLAADLRQYFGTDAILSRSGGDEFSAVLIGKTAEEAKPEIEAFTSAARYVRANGNCYPFYISLGYAEYPKDQREISHLIRYADMALYAVKLHGKQSCAAYQSTYETQQRSQFGFALQEVARHLPGAFLIYRADPDNDQILFANHELVEFAGCGDFEELLAYTDHHFRNLIRSDEQETVEKSIWQQIDAKTNGDNDYVRFHFVKKDGSTKQVLDHGRIVQNRYYGNIFYVLIMDCELIESYYASV